MNDYYINILPYRRYNNGLSKSRDRVIADEMERSYRILKAVYGYRGPNVSIPAFGGSAYNFEYNTIARRYKYKPKIDNKSYFSTIKFYKKQNPKIKLEKIKKECENKMFETHRHQWYNHNKIHNQSCNHCLNAVDLMLKVKDNPRKPIFLQEKWKNYMKKEKLPNPQILDYKNKRLFNKLFTTLKKVKNNNMNVNKMNLRKKLFDGSTKNFENKSLYASTKNDTNKSLLNKSLTTFKKAKENIWKRYNIPSTKLFITQQDCGRINSKHLKKVKRIAGV